VYIAMELVEGSTLRERLAAGPVAVPEALRIARQIAGALARAHDKGVVHRDLKPENVMLGAGDEVKILDFGIAKLREPEATEGALALQDTQTLEGRVMGTPGYMSPEQAAGRPVDQRTDVYAFGVVLHEMVTGKLPDIVFGRGTTLGDARIERILARCLPLSPSARWKDAGEILAALNAPARSRSGWILLGALLSVPLVALGVARGVVLARSGGGARSVVSVALPSPHATALTDLPPPASTVPEAIAEYRAGMQLLRDDSEDNARKRFERAAELDPAMAMAHLRSAMTGSLSHSPQRVRDEFARAVALRAQLGDRDRALLDAIEPLLGRAQPDDAEAIARLQAAHAHFPLDEEFLRELSPLTLGNVGLGPRIARDAIALDPEDAAAWEAFGRSLALAGDQTGARQAFERCASKSLEPNDCDQWLIELDAVEGHCADMERRARRIADHDPQSGNRFLAMAAAAVGRPESFVHEAYERSIATLPPDEREVSRALWEAQRESSAGRFGSASRTLAGIARTLASDSESGSDMAVGIRLAQLRADVSTEVGDPAGAQAVARELTERLDLLAQTARLGGDLWECWPLVRLAQVPLDPGRREWANAQLRASASGSVVWALGWAMPALTAADGREALAIFATDSRLTLPTGGEYAWWVGDTDGATGHVMVLAGKSAEALPYLRRQVDGCFAATGPFPRVRAQLDLARALRDTGDVKGACDAYTAVLVQWGHATPRSVSAEAARDGIKQLHCALP
jgi:serine/threonine-protein kinase